MNRHSLICWIRSALFLLVSGLLMLALAAPALAQVRVKVAPPKRRALLVAVQEFRPDMQEYFKDLKYTTRDAVLLYQVLKDPNLGHFDDVRVLASRSQLDALSREAEDILASRASLKPAQDEARVILTAVAAIESDPATPQTTLVSRKGLPTARDIRGTLEQFRKDLNERDDAFVYLTSHGFRAHAPRGAVLSLGDVMIAAADAEISPSQNGLEYKRETVLEMSELLETLSHSASKRLVVVQAACATSFKTEEEKRYDKDRERFAHKGIPEREQVPPDRDSSTITVIGAAKEAANEVQDATIRGDLFTWYFRMAISRRWRELGGEWANIDLDVDHDGAISIQEAYDMAEVAVRKATAKLPRIQEPYIVAAGSQIEPFIMSGRADPRLRRGVIYPPVRLVRTVAGKSLTVRANGQPVLKPQALEAGIHRFDLVDVREDGRTEVVDSVRFQVRPGDHIRPEDIFAPPPWRIELSLGFGQWLGTSYHAASDPRADGGLWTGGMLGVSAARTVLSRPDQEWAIELGGRLRLGSNGPVDNNLYATDDLVELSPLLQYRRKLYGPFHTELKLGMHGSAVFWTAEQYRTRALIAGWGPQVGLEFKVGARQHVTLGWDVSFVYADLDCNPDLQAAIPQDGTDIAALQEALPHRCTRSGDGYAQQADVYALSGLTLGWEWRF